MTATLRLITTCCLLASSSTIALAESTPTNLPGNAAAPSAEPASPRNVVYVNPLPIFAGVYNIGYERMVTRQLSVGVEGLTTAEGTARAYGLKLIPRLYLLRSQPSGVYVAPEFQAIYAKDSAAASGSAWGSLAGINVGWSWLAGPMNIKLSAGIAHYRIASDEVTVMDGPVGREESGLVPRLDLSLGAAF
ncbi:MAG: hypothetical protein AB7R00_11515 [Kofleriaceae bacterium]